MSSHGLMVSTFPFLRLLKRMGWNPFWQSAGHVVGVEVAYEEGDEDGDSAAEPYPSRNFFL